MQINTQQLEVRFKDFTEKKPQVFIHRISPRQANKPRQGAGENPKTGKQVKKHLNT